MTVMIDHLNDEMALMSKADEAVQRAAVSAARAVLDVENVRKVRAFEIIHATILHVGDEPAILERAPVIANTLAPFVRIPSFDLVFDRCVWVPRGRDASTGMALLVPSEVPAEWKMLRDQLSEIPRRLKVAKTGGERPHLTMAYNCTPFEPIVLDAPVVWPVTRFQLIRILMGLARHEEVGSWDLRA